MKAPVRGLRAGGEADAVEDFVPRDDAVEQSGTGRVNGLGCGEGGGNDDRAGMHDRLVEQVVELEAVRGGAVHQRGGRRRDGLLLADDRAVAARTFREHLLGHDPRPRLQAPEQRAAERVEQHALRALHDVGRQRFQLEPVHELDQLARVTSGGEVFLFHKFIAKTTKKLITECELVGLLIDCLDDNMLIY
ncbi:hypothetical protein D3C83_10130 [compost metagenome]